MAKIKTHFNRRSFLKVATASGAGLMLQFSWMPSLAGKKTKEEIDGVFRFNGFIKIATNGDVTIFSPNPEIGQNVKTSMPMIVAEELDVDWKKVMVEQAPLNTDLYTRQIAGGSQSIRQGWKGLRMAGATAKQMLKEAAAKEWGVPVKEISSSMSKLSHAKSGKSAGYGEMASAASEIKVPEEVDLKDVKDFKIIKSSTLNVDGQNIVTGKPLFGLDYKEDGMLIAMTIHPPAFGLKLKDFDKSKALAMPGITDVFTINLYKDDYLQGPFDITAFPELIVVVGNSTWQVMKAKKAIEAEWEKFDTYEVTSKGFGGNKETRKVPAGLENSTEHQNSLREMGFKSAKEARKDGDPEAVFKTAAKVIERSYTAPFLAHSTMEPMNFFANVTADKADLVGPIQTPEFMEKTVSERLGLPLEKIDIQMTRMGGGFGRRLYGHFLVEAAVISQKLQKPVKLIYNREDDMTFGIYRPAYHAYYKAALDENNNLVAFQVRAGGIPESPLFANRFPAGAVDNYLAEQWDTPTNITIGAFRAPRSNFMGGVEQAFLDEVAEAAGKDPIEFRLELLERAKNKPVGKNNDYDAARYAGVLELVRDKAGWKKGDTSKNRGVAAYYCHNSYVANVVDVVMEDDAPIIEKVYCSVDCGIVVNPIAASNMMEGGTVDGLGHAMYSAITFKDGKPEQKNFDKYKLIRNYNAPRDVQVDFVKNNIDPTGLGEPPFPPAIGALANALYKATGKRYYNQPFMEAEQELIM
ncbi:xanthine dehydrogenase family protein molybdopterin-binding subunit [Fulvivirga ligni]|uniref:xanthine dehydrogenase family protein molybdopterin-binding subunit n=1 Tax=Fulvivirga ligni TaxID=2904246 RepID=UPI001F4256D9|nr:molybdopterin cofactor-binding domain-containing protein [Fulvivirga ligni]UII24028.1 molybdopterin-dependent oxidoreductase [Fulvivirga ligni]